MTTELTFEQWFNKYNPIGNHEIRVFETEGEDLEELKKLGGYHVWSHIEGDGESFITNGFNTANRLCYYATEVPWEKNEEIEVTW